MTGTSAAPAPGGRSWKVFNDSVHGHVALHPLCALVIDTPQFQRLRHISQLGGTYYVFPAASHKRFEHSIGVSYLAERLVSTLRRNQPELDINDADVACVALAGLCHDLGHGPFSHLWERFMHMTRPERDWKHEESSVSMFRHLMADNTLLPRFRAAGLSDQDVVFIEEQITGPSTGRGCRGRSGHKVFLYEIISNKRNGIDVDKWDYFCRDSAALGINISFDYKRCLLYSRVINVEGEGWQICTRDKEAGNMYDLFYTRWVLHRRAYQHRVSRVVERMIVDILCLADAHLLFPVAPALCPSDCSPAGDDNSSCDEETPVEPGRLSAACDNMPAFTLLTDHVLQLVAMSRGHQLRPARRLLRRLHLRQLYAFIGCTQSLLVAGEQKIDTEAVRDSLGSEFVASDGVNVDDLIVEVVSVNYGMGDQNPIDRLRFYSKRRPNCAEVIGRHSVSALLPERFQETFIMAMCRQQDPEKIEVACRRFKQWCLTHEYSSPSRELWFESMNPVDGDGKSTAS